MASIDELVSTVNDQSTTIDSLVAFVKALEDQIGNIGGIPPAVQAKIDAVFAQVNKNSQAIADAIDNNPDTPAPVEPPADPTV